MGTREWCDVDDKFGVAYVNSSTSTANNVRTAWVREEGARMHTWMRYLWTEGADK